MLFALILILIIAGSVRLLNRYLPFEICPLCAGVSSAWIALTAGGILGIVPLAKYNLIIGILLGGTAVGVAYQAEKTFVWFRRNHLVFKIAFVLPGFLLAYWLASSPTFPKLILEITLLLVLGYLFFVSPTARGESRFQRKAQVNQGRRSKMLKEIEKKLEKCC